MPATATKSVDALGTGRRKTSVARVRIRAGSGKLTINDRDLEKFFTIDVLNAFSCLITQFEIVLDQILNSQKADDSVLTIQRVEKHVLEIQTKQSDTSGQVERLKLCGVL